MTRNSNKNNNKSSTPFSNTVGFAGVSHLSVESSRAQEGFIQNVHSIGTCQDDDALGSLES
jgi:hypothetical protein